MTISLLLGAIALVFIFEGLLPFVFPKFWKKMMAEASQKSERSLRLMGLASITVGMLILYIFN